MITRPPRKLNPYLSAGLYGASSASSLSMSFHGRTDQSEKKRMGPVAINVESYLGVRSCNSDRLLYVLALEVSPWGYFEAPSKGRSSTGVSMLCDRLTLVGRRNLILT